MRCQLSSLAANGWIAEEPERRDRTSAYKGALLQPLQFMFWSHLAHPDQWRHKSDRHRGLRPLIFLNNVAGSFTSASNWSTRTGRGQGQRLNVTAHHLNWERSLTASMISLVFFLKTLVDGPAGVWTHDLPLSRPAFFQLSLPLTVLIRVKPWK